MGADTYLTSLASIKEWLEISQEDTNADVLLTRMNRAVSAFVINHLNRDNIAPAQFRDVYDAYGNNFMVIRRNPVWSILGLYINGSPIPKAQGDGMTSPYTGGWALEPEYSVLGTQRLNLYGYWFPRGRGLITLEYIAGYITRNEAATVPGDDPYTVSTINHWLSDVSVTLADGTALVAVSSDPADGQYSVSDGVYTFNAAQAGADILITYGFTPADIQQAVIEIVGERYKYMDRIGVTSKSLGGQETVSFSQKAIASFVDENLRPYINVTPV